MRPYLGYVCIFLAAFCWGLIGPVARFAFAANLTPLEVAFWRSAFGGLFFMLHAAAQHSFRLRSPFDALAFALFGAISLGGFFASNQYAIKTGGAALAAVLLYTAPAWVALFSRIMFNERLTGLKLLAILMSLSGVLCISISGAGGAGDGQNGIGAPLFSHDFNATGILFGLLAGLLYSTHFIFSKKYLKQYTTYTLYGYCMLFGALALFPFIDFMPKSAWDWCIMLFLGFVCTYCAYLCYCEGLKRLAPTRAAVLATLEPVVATLAAWWIWGEIFTSLGWIGAVLVIGAVLCLILDPGRANTP